MNDDFNYKQVPRNYTHCLNAQCPRSADCLHFLVTRHVDKETRYFSVVNPAYVAEQKECPYFQPDRLIRFAIGITHLFDNLPHTKAVKIKKTMYSYFGRNAYYRTLHKQRLIKPEEQDFIRQTFVKEGVAEQPAFDEYIDQYVWF